VRASPLWVTDASSGAVDIAQADASIDAGDAGGGETDPNIAEVDVGGGETDADIEKPMSTSVFCARATQTPTPDVPKVPTIAHQWLPVA
jgi:hypothetical protein